MLFGQNQDDLDYFTIRREESLDFVLCTLPIVALFPVSFPVRTRHRHSRHLSCLGEMTCFKYRLQGLLFVKPCSTTTPLSPASFLQQTLANDYASSSSYSTSSFFLSLFPQENRSAYRQWYDDGRG